MPAPKTIVEDQDGEIAGENNAVDNVINTNYRSKGEKPRKKKRGGGRAVDDLAPLGLPVLDKPSAGMLPFRSIVLVFYSLCWSGIDRGRERGEGREERGRHMNKWCMDT